MKKLFFLIIYISITVFQIFAQAQSSVTLSGTVKGFDNQVAIYDDSEMGDLFPTSITQLFLPDSSGRFTIRFNLEKPNYFRIGRNTLYLAPGDNLSLVLDNLKPKEAVFKGKNSQVNVYLKDKSNPSSGSFLNGLKGVKSTIKETIDFIFLAAAEREEYLRSLKNISDDFRSLERARIKADILISLRYLEYLFPIKHKISKDSLSVFLDNYKTTVNPIISQNSMELDPIFLKLDAYRSIVYSLLQKKDKETQSARQITDWLLARSIAKTIKKIDDKEQLKTYQDTINSIHYPQYRSAVTEAFQVLVKFGKGDNAVGFLAVDPVGNPVQLQDFFGKVIFIDLWATWCAPCMPELEHLVRLKEKYNNNDKIVFISLSIDGNKEAWKKHLHKRNADGIQLNINSTELSDYSITGIPRTIVIDKDLKIIDMHGPMPSDKKIVEYLDKILQ